MSGSHQLVKGLAVALALLAPALLAGCIGPAQASAMEYQNEADDRAKAWDANARLVRILGVEGRAADWFDHWDAEAEADAEYWDRAQDDEELGDGKCEFWIYEYVVEGKAEKLVVVTDRDGEVLEETKEPRDDDDVLLGEWKVDSDEAVETALARNEHLREGTSSENYGLMILLQREEDESRPHWFIAGGGGNPSSGGGGIVKIDAVSGEVLMSHGGSSGWDDN